MSLTPSSQDSWGDTSSDSTASTPVSLSYTSQVHSLWPLGNLNVFPLDTIWNIFDELLMGSRTGRLTHEHLHAFYSFSRVNEPAAEMVKNYIGRQIPSAYLMDQISARWYPYSTADIPLTYDEIEQIAPLDNPLNGYDIVTDTIRDDCVDCFNRLSKSTTVPKRHALGCNEGGWSYVAIAACSNSFCLLEEFCTNSPYGRPIDNLARPANHNCVEVSPLDIMAHRQDLQFFERLIDLIVSPLDDLRCLDLISRGLSPKGRLDLCKFATPHLAARLHSVGVSLCDTISAEATAWHVGVSNGPAFLDYLFHNSQQPNVALNGSSRCRNTPLFAAVNADRLDSVRWLLEHDADVHLSHTGDPRCTPVHLAMTKGSEVSEAILEKLLSATTLGSISITASGMLLYSLIEGLIVTCHNEAVRNDIDEYEYKFLTNSHQQRAIRKCALIRRVTEGVRFIYPSLEPHWLLPDEPDLRWHDEAKGLAIMAGFENIVDIMEDCSNFIFKGCTSSPSVFRSLFLYRDWS
ncbi:uncharacterized protein N7498_006499 [Penicillium cinerascens]|uniref:Ankyrin n=1 Tax=Penicillium cinerascens TaxID=70096 RepID=A0A9W9MIC4_9EURO|nr:uncharacterized protein N7498_006499 [Penicillium cinerascens]KAJ5201836.1 hypothetical protein N7498_006499 [Penicillium cinerascens]